MRVQFTPSDTKLAVQLIRTGKLKRVLARAHTHSHTLSLSGLSRDIKSNYTRDFNGVFLRRTNDDVLFAQSRKKFKIHIIIYTRV